MLIERFGDEYKALMDAPLDEMSKVVDTQIAQAIVKVRDGTAKVTPGYDGVYGQLVLDIDAPPTVKLKPRIIQPIVKQKSMTDFW